MFVKLRSSLVASLLGAVPSGAQADPVQVAERFAAAAQQAPKYATALAYAVADGPVTIHVSGPTERTGDTAVSDDALWHIGSISKSFTAALVMQMVEAGRLDLDTPIKDYLPRNAAQMHDGWQRLTLRQLLSHTSGLAANAGVSTLVSQTDPDPRAARGQILSKYWTQAPKAPVGAFVYSNLGYVLAGHILEELTDTAWEDLVLDRIAGPLGLSSLGFGAPDGQTTPLGHRRILGMFPKAMSPVGTMADNPAWMGPAGTIHMNLADLVAWGRFHLAACAGQAPELLSRDACELMKTAGSDQYGLGWVVSPDNGQGPVIWHNGSNTMWYAVLAWMPDRALVVAATTNVGGHDRLDAWGRDGPPMILDEAGQGG